MESIDDLKSLENRRANILEAISKIEIPKKQFIIVGGAAMQLMGIKVSEDIDIVTTPKYMTNTLDAIKEDTNGSRSDDEITNRGTLLVATENGTGQRVHDEGYGVARGDVTYMLAPNDHLYKASFKKLRDEALDIGGFLVSPMQRVLEWKQAVNREKDQGDITLLQNYLSRSEAS